MLPCGYAYSSFDHKPSVIEWLRDNKSLPVFIKIGRYEPHVDESYKGMISFFIEQTSFMLTGISTWLVSVDH